MREYGIGTESVIVLHGGPAAAGDVAPLVRELGEQRHVFEPFQRSAGGRPLSVAQGVACGAFSTGQSLTLAENRLRPAPVE